MILHELSASTDWHIGKPIYYLSEQSKIDGIQFNTFQPWSQFDQAYWISFIIATLFCFSPSKLLAYFAPIVVIICFLAIAKRANTLKRVLAIAMFSGLLISFYTLAGDSFAFPSAIVQILTYSAFIVTFAIDHRYLTNPLLHNKIEKFISYVALAQSFVGIMQAIYSFVQTGTFDSNSGDAVAGTISASLSPDGTMSNYMFGVNFTFILLFLLPSLLYKRKRKITVLLVALTFILASVLHVMIFCIISFVAAFIFCWPALPKGRIQVILPLFGSGLVVVSILFLSTNWSLLPRLIRGVTDGEFPRALAYDRVFGVMMSKYPLMPIVGLGPGQFSSRAAAMASGYYLGGFDNPRQLPLLPASMSPAFNNYLLDLWIQSRYSAGSTSQPFSSWLAIYTEHGGLVSIAVIIILGYHILNAVLLAYRTKQRWTGTVVCAAMLFLFLLGFQDAYWEVPQAILVGVMLIKLLRAKLSFPLKKNYVWN